MSAALASRASLENSLYDSPVCGADVDVECVGQLGQETGGHVSTGHSVVEGIVGHVTVGGHWIGVGGVSVGHAP